MKSEARIQHDCYLWFHNEFPELRGLLCYNLNNSMDKVEQSRNKALGLQPGRSDMVFYYRGKAWHIELKKPGGRQSKAQKKWQQTIQNQGFQYVLIDGLEDFKIIIQKIIDGWLIP